MENRCKLFVGGLDLSTTTAKLSYFFQQWGNVVDANVMTNSHTMMSRGFGFVRYATPQMVDEAMKHRPHIIDGRSVESKRPMPRELTSADNNMSCFRLLVRSSTVDTQSAINDVSVRSYFGNFGNVVSVTAPQNPSGDFVVEFDDYDPVDKAILHGNHQLNGQTLVINKDTSAPSPQPNMSIAAKPEQAECKLFIGGLDHFTTDTSLADHFRKFGEVVMTQVMYDPLTQRSRGFGFVMFATTSSAVRALSEQPHIIDSRTVDVKPFATRDQISKNPAAMKKGDVNHDCKLFVGGLSTLVDDDALRAYFGKYGDISSGLVMKDPNTKRSRGFAFLTFANADSVDRVMAARPHSLSDKAVEVKRPMPRDLATPENTITVTKLFVGAVRDGTTEDQMREHFAKFGNIVDLCLPMDRSTGRLRGFSFVEYDDYDAADKAMVSGSHEVNGRQLDVKKALPKEMARMASGAAPGVRQPPYGAAPGGGMPGFGGPPDPSGYQYGYNHGAGGPGGDYGAPPAAGYGQAPPAAGYGAPAAAGGAGGYGAPPMGGYGAGSQGQGGYGAAPQAPGGYGAASQAPGGYGPGSQAQGGYGPGSQAQGGYGAASQAPGGYGAPSQAPGGYAAPTQGQPGYGGPAQTAPGGYGAPAQGQPGYGGPAQTAPGSGGTYGAGQYGAAAPQSQSFPPPQQPAMGYGARANGAGQYGAQQQQPNVGPYGAAGNGTYNGASGAPAGSYKGQTGGVGPMRGGHTARAAPYNVGQRNQMAAGAGKAPVGQRLGAMASGQSGYRY